MGLFQEINTQARKQGLEFLVIGGLAVIFHGYTRDTADLDLLIRRNERMAWLDLLALLKYTIKTERDNFVQLSPPEQGAWPVDLMLVQNATFLPMFEAGIEVEMYGARLKIPTLDHLRRAVTKGYFVAPTLSARPQFVALRGNPVFQSLLAEAEAGRQRALAAFRQAGGDRLLGR